MVAGNRELEVDSFTDILLPITSNTIITRLSTSRETSMQRLLELFVRQNWNAKFYFADGSEARSGNGMPERVVRERADNRTPAFHDVIPSHHLKWYSSQDDDVVVELPDSTHEAISYQMPITVEDSVGLVRLTVIDSRTREEAVYYTRSRPDFSFMTFYEVTV